MRQQLRELQGLVHDGVRFATRGRGRREAAATRLAHISEPTQSLLSQLADGSGGGSKGKHSKGKSKGKSKSKSRAKDTAGADLTDIGSGSGSVDATSAPTAPAPAPVWQPTRTGHLAIGARETGVKVSMA